MCDHAPGAVKAQAGAHAHLPTGLARSSPAIAEVRRWRILSPMSRVARLAALAAIASVAPAAALADPAHPPAPPSAVGASAPPAALAPLRADQVESLVLLGRVWGFVKYHHPRVTGGALDWDVELRRVIARIMAAPATAAARDTIDAWLADVGDPPACAPCAILPTDAHLQPDVAWLGDTAMLGASLGARLQRIHANRSVAPTQHYVRLVRGIGNPDFTNEDAYAADSLPPADLRLLGVFRFWNMLEYWFPYRDLMEHDRVAILREFVPAAWDADDVGAYHRTMMRLVARAQDGHANLWSSVVRYQPPEGAFNIPVTLRSVEGRYVVTGFSHPNGAATTRQQRGDVVLRVDGVPVDSATREWAPYYGASNEPARRRELARALTRGADGLVRLDIERDGRLLTVTTPRLPVAMLDRRAGTAHDRPGDTFQMLSDGRDSVAYLKLSTVVASDVPEYLRRAAGARVLVVDIRNYPSAFVVFALGRHLVAERREFARVTVGSPSNPGAFTWTTPISLSPAEPRFERPVVVLVDESSQSQAEYTAMALRTAPGALVVGSTTAGADGNVSRIVLPGGLGALISGIGVFYPDRRPTQQVGIVPDLEVRPTVAGIRAGRDEVLEAAIGRVLGREFRVTP